MKKILILFIGIFLCNINTEAQVLMNTDQFKDKLGTVKDAQLIDVRTPGEYTEGHLSHAQNIDFKNAAFTENINKLDKSKPVFLYCLVGGRSAEAAKILKENGFNEVYDMQGGYLKWTTSGKLIDAPLSSSAPKGLSTSDYKKIIQSSELVLIDFYAKWCAPCVKMLPVVNKLTEEYKSKALIKTINYDANKDLAKELNIDEIPAFLLYKKGKLIRRETGFLDETAFRHLLDQNLL
jgi:thioredoxin 1